MRHEQSICVGEGQFIGRRAAADENLLHTGFRREIESLRQAANGLSNRWNKARIPRENEWRVIAKPAEHLRVGAAAKKQPFASRGGSEVNTIPWQIPGHALAA